MTASAKTRAKPRLRTFHVLVGFIPTDCPKTRLVGTIAKQIPSTPWERDRLAIRPAARHQGAALPQ